MTDKLPDCCIPREGASAAEILYCAYQRGGPPERAGLAWHGQPCPTWAELLGEAFLGDLGKQGVIAKWEAVVTAVTDLPKPQPDGLPLPCWVRLDKAGHRSHYGYATATPWPETVLLREPAVSGEPMSNGGEREALPERIGLHPITGGMVYGVTVITEEEAIEGRRKERRWIYPRPRRR